MPYDPTIDPPDVQADRRPPEDHPTECEGCGNLLDIVSDDGRTFEAECLECGAAVTNIGPDDYDWVFPEGVG